jgi:hypothetical protein
MLHSEVGLAGRISSTSSSVRMQIRRQFQQLIVWRIFQPRSQLIKVLRRRQPDVDPFGPPPQETI